MTLNHIASMLQCLLLKRIDVFSFDAKWALAFCHNCVIQCRYHKFLTSIEHFGRLLHRFVPSELNRHDNSVELYFMLLVTSAVKALPSISQNGISPITLNKQLGNHLEKDIINASISLSSFSFSALFHLSFLFFFSWMLPIGYRGASKSDFSSTNTLAYYKNP